jgi:hypothetical protein
MPLSLEHKASLTSVFRSGVVDKRQPAEGKQEIALAIGLSDLFSDFLHYSGLSENAVVADISAQDRVKEEFSPVALEIVRDVISELANEANLQWLSALVATIQDEKWAEIISESVRMWVVNRTTKN